MAFVLGRHRQRAEKESPRRRGLRARRPGLFKEIRETKAARQGPAGHDREHREHRERCHHHGR